MIDGFHFLIQKIEEGDPISTLKANEPPPLNTI
jgi:hypothetical protein